MSATIDLKPAEDGKAVVFINGFQVGDIWVTSRGGCFQKTLKDFALTTEHMQLIVAAMKAAEIYGTQTDG